MIGPFKSTNKSGVGYAPISMLILQAELVTALPGLRHMMMAFYICTTITSIHTITAATSPYFLCSFPLLYLSPLVVETWTKAFFLCSF